MRRAAAAVLAMMLLVPGAALAGQGDVLVCFSFLFPIDTTSDEPGTIPDLTEKQLARELRQGGAVIFARGQCPSDPEPAPRPTREPTPAPEPSHEWQLWDEDLLWRWLDDDEYRCPAGVFESGKCVGIGVEAITDCETGVSVTVQFVDDDDFVVDYANGSVGPLRSGQRAKVALKSGNLSAQRVQIARLTCE